MTIQAQGGNTVASYARIHPISRFAARVAVAATGCFIVLVAILHVIAPEYGPSWRFLSEYAVGPYGWVMALAFLTMAAACAALFIAIRTQVRGAVGYLGLAVLLLTIVGMTMAAFFPMDLITIDPADATDTGRMHAISAMFGIPSMPIGALLISLDLGGRPGWSQARRSMLWAAVAVLVSLVLMFMTIGILLPQNGGFGPAVPVGWLNRQLMLAYCAWVLIVGWQAAKPSRT